VGFLLVFVRKSPGGVGDAWSDVALLAVLLIPCLLLYALGIWGFRNSRGLRAWESVYLVFALLFVPLVLFQFIEMVNGDTGAAINVLWIFLVTAAVAGAVWLVTGVRYQLLLGSLALIVAWSAFWDAVLSGGIDEHFTVYRLMLLVIAAALVIKAVILARRWGDDAERASGAVDVVTAAGIAAVVGAGVISLAVGAIGGGLLPEESAAGIEPTNLWNLVLLLAGLALVAFGSRVWVRGPAYVGAVGLGAFVILAASGLGLDDPGTGIGGWALATLIAGAVAVLLSLVPLLRIGGGKPAPRSRARR
jgi:hypothetical protein